MKTFTIIALLSTLAVGSSIPRSLMPLPSPIHTTATSTASVMPLPTVVHDSSNDYHHMIDLLRANGGGQTGGQSTGENKREESVKIEAREDCWERVDGWCAPYCDDMYPGPDTAAKRQACFICIAVQSAFCLA